jgi:hypothetical protein
MMERGKEGRGATREVEDEDEGGRADLWSSCAVLGVLGSTTSRNLVPGGTGSWWWWCEL